MAIIRCLMKVKSTRRSVGRTVVCRSSSYGRCFSFNHFLKDIKNVYSSTPDDIVMLFEISSIGPYKIPFIAKPSEKEKVLINNPRNLFVVINTNHTKRAHSESYVNKHRELLWKVLNQLPLENPKDNLVSIYFQRMATYASPADIEEQFRQCVLKYLRKQSFQPESKGNSRQFFSILFPFNVHKWDSWKSARRHFYNIYGQLGTTAFSMFLCHHYKIHSSLRLQELLDDLRDFRQMLDKFDFFALFDQILSSNFKQLTTRSRKLIRILKWRTIQTQEYLVFLINEFGPENIRQSLQLFQEIYRTRPHSTLLTQLY